MCVSFSIPLIYSYTHLFLFYSPILFTNHFTTDIPIILRLHLHWSFRLNPLRDGHHLVLVPVVQVPNTYGTCTAQKDPQTSFREVNRPDHQGTDWWSGRMVLFPPRAQGTMQPLVSPTSGGSLPTRLGSYGAIPAKGPRHHTARIALMRELP